jgi:plastocyanin
VTSDARRLLAVVVATVLGAACAGRPLPLAPEADAAPSSDSDRDGDGDSDGDGPSFRAVAPCPSGGDYATGTDVVSFGFLGTPPGFSYDPKCLAIAAGDSVTFSGSFAAHPLYPSARRGDVAGNPITGVGSGDTETVLFPRRGFFAYFCGAHGATDDGSAMAGAIWVR